MVEILKITPDTWYRYNARFSIELLLSYVQGVERQVADSIEEYRKLREIQSNQIEAQLEDETDYPNVVDLVETHRGLDSESWDLPSIFEEHFPNLQRRSALITLYSFLEYELNKLGDLFVRDQKLKVSFSDMRGLGLDRAILFLEKVVGLQIDKKTAPWQEVTKIRELRNCIVHANAKLKDWSGKPKGIAQYVENSISLSGEDEIKLSGDYLFHVLETFDRQFQELDRAIGAHFQLT